MSLKSCEKVETNVYELLIALEGDAFKSAVMKAYTKNKSKYNVPGFRKGKAPKHVIETYYGKEVFLYDAVDAEYPALFESAIEEAKLDIVSAPFDDKLEEINENGFSVRLKVTVKPEVEVKLYKGISAEKEKVTVKKSEIKDEINRALEKDARTVTVENKAAKKGDIANIDFEGFLDGVAFEGGKGEGHDLELGSGSFIPGFEDQVIGHKTGEEFDVNVTFPEEYGAEELAGKPAVFKVKINKISKKELPVYDDEFVKDVSEFDTVADYEKHLEEEIKERKEHAAQHAFEDAVIATLIENTVAEIPAVMVDKEVDSRINEFDYNLQRQGISLDMYLSYLGTKIEDLRESYKADAEKSVKLRLALEKIVELEGVEVSDEDVEKELQSYADAYGMELEKVKSLVSAEDVKADIACRKAMDIVKESAVEAKKKAPAKKKTEAADGEEKAEKKAPAKKAAPKKKASATEAEAE